MSLLITIVLILGDIFLPPPGIPLFTLLYFGWKYIKLKIKADIYLTYLLFFGIPQILLFAIVRTLMLPFKGSWGALKFIEDKLENLTAGVEWLEHNPKKGIFGAVISGILAFVIVNPSMETLMSLGNVFTLSGFREVGITLALLLGGAFLPIVVIATIWSAIKGLGGSGSGGNDKLDSMYTSPGGSPKDAYNEMTEAVDQRRETAEAVEKGAEKAGKAASKVESKGLGNAIKTWFKGNIPGNVESVGKKLVRLNPMSKAGKKAGKKASKKVAGKQIAGKAATVAKTGKNVKNVSLLPLIPIAGGLLLLQLGIILLIFGFVVELYLPYVMGPMASAAGFSADYANYGGQAIAPYIPNINLEPVTLAAQSQVAKLQCFSQGPECFTEWQMNNTQRPGSEEEGERFDLRSEGFELEQGQTIDVAYQDPARPLSVSFALENPRNGLKGIPARDVQYKVQVWNDEDEVCGTDFVPISFYEQTDIDETTIPPGDSYIVGVRTDQEETLTENLNLFDCELLQPGQARITRTAELSYMYDYFSQSNLRVRAMSYENYADRDLERGYEKSETADTPVKSFINVYAPVIYDELEDGERNARPFEVQIGFQTDDPDVKYRVQPESVTFTPSRSTEIIEGSCGDFELKETGRADVQTYELDDNGIEQINSETFDANRWYTTARSPSILECTMKLANPDEVSSSGETLIMDVSANYTVIKDDITDDFQVWNTLCSGRDCPLLIPKQELDGQADWVKDKLISTCSPALRVTAVGGCDVRSLGLEEGTNIEDEDSLNKDAWQNGIFGREYGNDVINYEHINEGDTAYDWNYFIEEEVSDSAYQYAHWSKTGGKPVIGMTQEEWDKIARDEDAPGRALYLSGYDDIDTEFEDDLTERIVCKEGFGSKEAAVQRFAEIWGDRRGVERMLYLKPWTVKSSCDPSQGWWGSLVDVLRGYDREQQYQEKRNNCDGVLTVNSIGEYMCYN